MVMRTSSVLTEVPLLTLTEAIVPAEGVTISFSIFIASRTSTTEFASILSPTELLYQLQFRA